MILIHAMRTLSKTQETGLLTLTARADHKVDYRNAPALTEEFGRSP
jgi:hypothetical protein